MGAEAANNYLVITALGEDRIGLVEKLSARITDCGCNIEESRMAVLGEKFALIMQVAGPWNALSKLEGQLASLGEQLGCTLLHERTRKREQMRAAVPYSIEVIAMDHLGVVQKLSAFFARNGINIEELQTRTYLAPHTGTMMFSVNMTVGIPANTHIPTLRGDFLDYCDDLNFDAIFEPVRG